MNGRNAAAETVKIHRSRLVRITILKASDWGMGYLADWLTPVSSQQPGPSITSLLQLPPAGALGLGPARRQDGRPRILIARTIPSSILARHGSTCSVVSKQFPLKRSDAHASYSADGRSGSARKTDDWFC